MAGPILPPNTPLINEKGHITREWYSYLVLLQTRLAQTPSDIDDATLIAGAAGLSDAFANDDETFLWGNAFALEDWPDDLRPAYDFSEAQDDLSGPDNGLMVEEADLRYVSIRSSLALSIRTATTTAAAIPSLTDGTLLCNATGAAIVVALPAAASSAGRMLNIKKIDASANTVTIDPNGAELVDGAATLALTAQYQSTKIQCDGTAWWVL